LITYYSYESTSFDGLCTYLASFRSRSWAPNPSFGPFVSRKRSETRTRCQREARQTLPFITASSSLQQKSTLQSIPTLVNKSTSQIAIAQPEKIKIRTMATRCAFENSNEIGVFAALTNAYCLTGTFCCGLLTTVECVKHLHLEMVHLTLFVILKGLVDPRTFTLSFKPNWRNISPSFMLRLVATAL
jgi:hypothetical protein